MGLLRTKAPLDAQPFIHTMVAEPTSTQPTEQQLLLNADTLSREISWFARVVNFRLAHYFHQEPPAPEQEERSWWSLRGSTSRFKLLEAPNPDSEPDPLDSPPNLLTERSVYAEFVGFYNLTVQERILLMLGLIPHIQPHLLDVFFIPNKALGRGYSEFGGVKGVKHGGFLPTVETALFILAGNDLGKRFDAYRLFEPTHVLLEHNVLYIDPTNGTEPYYSSQLGLSEEYVDFFTTGQLRTPPFSLEFPAKRLYTRMDWSDLIMDENTARQIEEIRIWLEHGRTLYETWDMGKRTKPGYKALFYGPPGTGKTLTAALLGKTFGLQVYRIDLSMVVSKYIGETEKNLEKVFRKAENKNWILFFDEADALFGKRTNISDSHDKYANQEIAYLLQRLEDYAGLVILASNMRQNVDEAFSRRLQSVIYFPKPQPKERLKLWQNAISQKAVLEKSVDLDQCARQYDLAGGSIVNVIQYASLMALNRAKSATEANSPNPANPANEPATTTKADQSDGRTIILLEDIVQGIRKEYRKEGKSL